MLNSLNWKKSSLKCFSVLFFLIISCDYDRKKELSEYDQTDEAIHQFVHFIAQSKINLKPNVVDTITLWFEVDSGYHIQAHEVGDSYLIATKITLGDDSLKEWFSEIVYPTSIEFYLGASDTLFVYDGSVEFKIPIHSKKEDHIGIYSFPGELLYQACDDNSCFFPRTLNFEVRINVTE